MSVSALPGENRSHEILFFYPMQYDYLINITHKNTFFHIFDFLIDTVHFSTAYSKIARNAGPLCEHKHGDAFSIH